MRWDRWWNEEQIEVVTSLRVCMRSDDMTSTPPARTWKVRFAPPGSPRPDRVSIHHIYIFIYLFHLRFIHHDYPHTRPHTCSHTYDPLSHGTGLWKQSVRSQNHETPWKHKNRSSTREKKTFTSSYEARIKPVDIFWSCCDENDVNLLKWLAGRSNNSYFIGCYILSELLPLAT